MAEAIFTYLYTIWKQVEYNEIMNIKHVCRNSKISQQLAKLQDINVEDVGGCFCVDEELISKVKSAFKQKPINLEKIQKAAELIREATPLEKRALVINGSFYNLCKMIEKMSRKEPSVEKKKGFVQRWFGKNPPPTVKPTTGNGTGYTPCVTQIEGKSALKTEKTENLEENLSFLIKALRAFIYPYAKSYNGKPAKKDFKYIDSYVVDQVRSSGVLTIMKNYLNNDNILIVSKNTLLYERMLELAVAMSTVPSLMELLMETKESRSLAKEIIPNFTENINRFMNLFGYQIKDDNEMIDFIRMMNLFAKIISTAVERENKEEKNEEENEVNVESSNCEEDLDAKYRETMKEYQLRQFRMINDNGNFLIPFLFEKEVKASNRTALTTNTKTRRVAKELAALMTSLPLNASNSIFVLVDESRCDVVKAVVTGPEDTPYANGLFEFDIFFPDNYPESPPKVQLVTTNGGKFRFNPNLYKDGKVCLSLLGTWEGHTDERWTKQSTLLQVLISIQSLILVKEPYFNEPGYEVTQGTPRGEKLSREYNLDKERGTILYAIAGFCPPYFKDLACQHFILKKDDIMKRAKKWVRRAREDKCDDIPIRIIYGMVKDLEMATSSSRVISVMSSMK